MLMVLGIYLLFMLDLVHFSINTSILKCTYSELASDSRFVGLSLANFTVLIHDIFNHLQIPKKDKSKLLENLGKVQILK
jgi:hypothetical protein